MGSVHQICLRWNNHQTNFPKVFNDLRMSKDLVDVTLCCEGRKIKAHKLVLSACSPYFQSLFTEVPCKHPVIFFRDIPFAELDSLINYMYKGEVSVAKDNLDQFLKTAESLQVKGLIMEPESDHVPAVKETVPVPTKQVTKKTEPVTQHITKESTWSPSYPSQPRAPAATHKEPSSQATFTPTTVPVQTIPSHTTFHTQPKTTQSHASFQQPATPQSQCGGSSRLQSPAHYEEEEDDDVIIEPDIKTETMDHSVGDPGAASMGDGTRQHDMDTDMYITGDDPSDSMSSYGQGDDLESIMSNIVSQQGGSSMDLGLGLPSHDPQSEEFRTSNRKKRISLEQKVRIIEMVEGGGKSMRQIEREFGLGNGSVRLILLRKDRIREELMQGLHH